MLSGLSQERYELGYNSRTAAALVEIRDLLAENFDDVLEVFV